MSDYKLYEGINNIDDDLIEEADRKASPIIRKYYSFAAAAAVVLLAFGAAGWGLFHKGNELLDKDKHDVDIISEIVTTTSGSEDDIICTSADTGHTSVVTTTSHSGKKQATASETAADANGNTTGSGKTPKVTTYTVTKKRDIKTTHSVGNNAVTTTRAKAGGNVTTALTTMPAPVVTTDVTTQQYSELDKEIAENERSIFMKKYLASLAAAATLANYVPTGLVQADYNPFDENDYIDSIYLSDFESGRAITDVNNDGVFDRNDLVPVYSYLMNSNLASDEEKEAASVRGDANLSGEVKMNDFLLLSKYYLYKYGVNPDDFNMYNYKDIDGNVTLESYNFVESLRYLAIEDGWAYKYETELIKNGEVDIDFNGDGKFEIFDVLDYSLYNNYTIQNPFNETEAKSESIITDESWNKCKLYKEKCFFDNDSVSNLIKYYLCNNEFDPHITTYDFYTEYTDNLLQKFASSPRKNNITGNTVDYTYAFVGNVKTIAIDFDLMEFVDRRSKILIVLTPDFNDILAEQFADYEAKVLNGTLPPPDVNSDGVCDINDYLDMTNYYFEAEDNETEETTKIGVDTFRYLDTQFDINGNGISGDGFDLQVACDFVGKYTSEDSTVDLNALLAAYNEKHGAGNNSTTKTQLSEVDQIKFLEAFSSEPIKRSGDANNSGTVNMADAVTILCSCCNPDEFPLTEWGEFNADVNNTGDGVTAGDAATIQRRLVGLEK